MVKPSSLPCLHYTIARGIYTSRNSAALHEIITKEAIKITVTQLLNILDQLQLLYFL
jgi:hypothetical protein